MTELAVALGWAAAHRVVVVGPVICSGSYRSASANAAPAGRRIDRARAGAVVMAAWMTAQTEQTCRRATSTSPPAGQSSGRSDPAPQRVGAQGER